MAIDGHEEHADRATLVSAIVAFCLESVFFGAFAVAYGIAVRVLLVNDRPRDRRIQRRVLFAGSTAIFVLALVHVALDMTINLRTFVSIGEDRAASASTFDSLNSLENPIGVTKWLLYVCQSFIGDGFMIYRTYVVWDRSWRVIIVPTVILFGDVVLGYVTAGLGGGAPTGCVNSFFVLSFVANAISSGLIMRRICMSRGFPDDELERLRFKNVRRGVIESLFQSAAIYSVCSIVLAVVAFASPHVGFIACHSVFSSIIGLVFVTIVIRISQNTDFAADARRRTAHQAMASGISLVGAPLEGTIHRSLHMRNPIAITVSISTTSQVDEGSADDEKDTLDDKVDAAHVRTDCRILHREALHGLPHADSNRFDLPQYSRPCSPQTA
ncbi:hypothetical protein PYCCODRAFT_1277099 [Trametes coccinea BRFM310]|uniref:Uncharacterized protein n=1 Tax=Trametes coccinea (strain BRFM310) TaxID=1353009 RepID=A0A1Y2IWI9_TRAC3|nr:hypothetical protein PYCCODRAFT_1277099 [Trametes coccinea BRFM310]